MLDPYEVWLHVHRVLVRVSGWDWLLLVAEIDFCSHRLWDDPVTLGVAHGHSWIFSLFSHRLRGNRSIYAVIDYHKHLLEENVSLRISDCRSSWASKYLINKRSSTEVNTTKNLQGSHCSSSLRTGSPANRQTRRGEKQVHAGKCSTPAVTNRTQLLCGYHLRRACDDSISAGKLLTIAEKNLSLFFKKWSIAQPDIRLWLDRWPKRQQEVLICELFMF